MLGIRGLADANNPESLSNRMHARRFQLFERLIARLPRPLRILDVGGTPQFWENRGWAGRNDCHITLLNLASQESTHPNITCRTGDATQMPEFADGSFDVAFSNSVIEHLFTIEKQKAMAREIHRVAKAYWLQTPNFWFPIEPHFHVPGWQWLPVFVRVAIIRRRTCGWRGRTSDPVRARALVTEVRLMTRRELRALFPQAKMMGEKFCGLKKSWIVYHGFSTAGPVMPVQ